MGQECGRISFTKGWVLSEQMEMDTTNRGTSFSKHHNLNER